MTAMTYDEWLKNRVIYDPQILMGGPVFKGSRLSVVHIGELIARGEKREVMEDYPYLTDDDLIHAETFYRSFAAK